MQTCSTRRLVLRGIVLCPLMVALGELPLGASVGHWPAVSVNIALLHAPLRQAMFEVSRGSKVVLSCNQTLARHCLTLITHGRRLEEVAEQIALLAATSPGKASWKPVQSADSNTWALTEDDASRTARQSRIESRARTLRERFRETTILAGLSDEELIQHRSTRPHVVVSMSTYRPLTNVVGSLPANSLELVMRGVVVKVPYDRLAPPQQAAIRQMVGDRQFTVTHPDERGNVVIDYEFDSKKDMGTTGMVVRLAGNPDHPGVRAMVELTPRDRVGCLNLLEPPPPPREDQPLWLRTSLDRVQELRRRERVQGQRPPKEPALLQKVSVRWSVKRPNEPERFSAISDVLSQISAQVKLPVAAHYDPGFIDYYGREDFRYFKHDIPPTPLWQVLDQAAELWDLRWEWDEKARWLRVRSPRVPWALAGHIDMRPPGS